MADDADRAQAYEAMAINHAIHQRRTAPRAVESLYACADCGEPIPEARRQAIPGCLYCVWCQQEHERERGRL